MSSDYQGTLTFMTDPVCSWCWGMLPEIFRLQDYFSDRLEFQIRCAGLQVGSQKPLTEAHIQQLITLWQQVAETTGQRFAFSLPKDASFIYHSELACRTIQIARQLIGAEPWDLFHDMQHAFYVECQNLGDLDTLSRLIRSTGVSNESFLKQINDDGIVSLTRKEFEWCKAQGIAALPTLFLDLGNGPKLVCGGFATSEFLIPELSARLTTH